MARLTLIYLSICLSWASAQKSCYDLAGNVAESDTPCNPNNDESLCCQSSYICLSNSLCFNPIGNELSRGVCHCLVIA